MSASVSRRVKRALVLMVAVLVAFAASAVSAPRFLRGLNPLSVSPAAALSGGQSIAGWGGNSSGQLGNGTTTASLTPGAVSSLTTAIQVSEGSAFSLALASDGTVWSWGTNASGQLGIGSSDGSPRLTPQH